jgi:hypothetical protein
LWERPMNSRLRHALIPGPRPCSIAMRER